MKYNTTTLAQEIADRLNTYQATLMEQRDIVADQGLEVTVTITIDEYKRRIGSKRLTASRTDKFIKALEGHGLDVLLWDDGTKLSITKPEPRLPTDFVGLDELWEQCNEVDAA